MDGVREKEEQNRCPSDSMKHPDQTGFDSLSFE